MDAIRSEHERPTNGPAPRGHAAAAPARSLGYKRQVEIDVDAPHWDEETRRPFGFQENWSRVAAKQEEKDRCLEMKGENQVQVRGVGYGNIEWSNESEILERN